MFDLGFATGEFFRSGETDSGYQPLATRSTKTRTICSHCSQNVFDTANGDDDPAGTMVQFVADFVNGFIEQVGFEHDLKIVAVFRDENRAGGGLQIALQKDADRKSVV